MKHLFAAVLLSTLAVAQTSQAPAPAPPTKPIDVTLTGCLVQGSSPAIFLLENAVDPTKKDDTPMTYRLVPISEDPDFQSSLDHKVQATGVPEVKTPAPGGGKVPEKDLPTFTMKAFRAIADTCSGSQR